MLTRLPDATAHSNGQPPLPQKSCAEVPTSTRIVLEESKSYHRSFALGGVYFSDATHCMPPVTKIAGKLLVQAAVFRAIDCKMRKITDLDAFDRRLLARVRHNNLEPARLLAERVGLSMSAVLRRLARLRDDRVIVADVSIVNPALTGSALTLHILVRMREPGRRVRDVFSAGLAAHPEVTGAWEVTGDDDYVVKVQVASMAEYDLFIRRALGEENGVAAFKTLITINTIVEEDASARPLIA